MTANPPTENAPNHAIEPRLSLRPRVAGLIIAFGALGLLIVAAGLSPSEDGHGTHTQLGLAPCPWVMRWNVPCPSCGMTTAFAYAANGDLISAGATQPFGTLLALTTAVVAWGGLHTGISGVNPGRLIQRGTGLRTTIVVISLFLGAWVYKMIVW